VLSVTPRIARKNFARPPRLRKIIAQRFRGAAESSERFAQSVSCMDGSIFTRSKIEIHRLNRLRNNSHPVIPKGGVCPRNLLFLGSRAGNRSLASLGMTRNTFSASCEAGATETRTRAPILTERGLRIGHRPGGARQENPSQGRRFLSRFLASGPQGGLAGGTQSRFAHALLLTSPISISGLAPACGRARDCPDPHLPGRSPSLRRKMRSAKHRRRRSCARPWAPW